MNKIFVFDVDGTLTPSRQPMDAEFKTWFKRYFNNREYVLVSGSDYAKLAEQVGEDILTDARFVFPCSGNNMWMGGTEYYRSDWYPSEQLLADLNVALNDNSYDVKTGNHIEIRTGLVNFSFVGRNCTQEQRKAYAAWDREHSERLFLTLKLREKYPDLKFEIGGEISLDIYPLGCDKAQILKHLQDYDVLFFGDGIEPGKNDYSLACALTSHNSSESFAVTCWQDTQEFLKKLDS